MGTPSVKRWSVLGNLSVTPGVLIFIAALAIFPFISTVTGSGIKLAGLEVWKYFWIVWLIALLLHIYFDKRFLKFPVSRLEIAVWLLMVLMLILAPKPDLIIDPWKNWFFSVLTLVFLRLFALSDSAEIETMIKATLGIWWSYTLMLLVYVLQVPNYPGSIQHQFYLSGMLGLAVTLLLLVEHRHRAEDATGIRVAILVTAVTNVGINVWVTETRSVFPFSLALVLTACFMLINSKNSRAIRGRYLGLPIAIGLALAPVLHLSGQMGNLVNEWTHPIFGKLRTVESKTGREAAFEQWMKFVLENARFIGPAKGPIPVIEGEAETSSAPIFGLSSEQYEEIKQSGMAAQAAALRRQRELGVVLHAPVDSPVVSLNANDTAASPPQSSIALTSSHNQWLDAIARSGVLYALLIALSFCYVVWLISVRLSLTLPAALGFSYWLLAVAWGVASQFDDEHWLYHIPYLSLFFLPVLATAFRKTAISTGKTKRGTCAAPNLN